jgi:acyl-CoA thioesterase
MVDLNNNELILKYIEINNFGKLLGMDFTIHAAGIVEYRMTIKKEHLATPNAAHGGAIAGLLDATVGVGALSAVCADDKVVSTVEMKTTFFAPAYLNDQLIARSELLKKGNRIIFMEATVFNQKGDLVAKASSTLNSYPKEKAGY